ncbi:uncharacterized protein knl1 isoform X2 [Parambassis ranga]|uniref:Uncharacterized protein knl1 isoform X2 n=1 Tax=Parambassis ranga TaxID=210632 RepID=A0A6P7HIK1_9TELE|nr:kinetochore scaffold 1 isoform X2 [Parambassis ranga]
MEPLDPLRNIEGSVMSKRRISSILKAPRKSTRFSDTEQQENVVECPKPVERRNSRRVSFAPANDVLLFSKDVKNTAPAQNPLQELKTATTTAQSRVQMMVAEDGSQIMGMENLLSAPLHASQPRDKVFFDDDFGEKTVMFSTDDAFMDMTHSHTINIAKDAKLLEDIPLHNYDIVPTPGEKKAMFTMEDVSKDLTLSHRVTSGSVSTGRNMDVCVEKRNLSRSSLGFDDFLATLFNTSGPSTNTAVTRTTPPAGPAQINAQNADVDKENQAPPSARAVKEKSLNNTRKVGGLFCESTLCPEDDVCMDMTEAQTGRILGVNDDDDPFRCLFPTQEMYAHPDKRLTQTTEMKTKLQPGSKTSASADLKGMEISKVQRHQDKPDTEDDRMEKIVRFSADDAGMDGTGHTVNLATKLQSLQNLDFLPFCGEKTVRFNADDAAMDMTQCITVNIDSALASDSVVPKASEPSINPAITRVTSPSAHSPCGDAVFPDEDVGMDLTEAQTGRIMTGLETSLKTSLRTTKQRQQDKPDPEDDHFKTVRFSADDACMDVTRSYTVNIADNLKLQSLQNLDFLSSCGEKTMRFSADDACMDVTRCHTVNIADNLKLQSLQNQDFLPSCGEKTVRFNADDASMDMTEAQTGRIINLPATGDPLQCNQVTSYQVSCDTAGPSDCRGLESLLKMSLKGKIQGHQVKSDAVDDGRERTVRFTADDACMNVTQSHTVQIASHSEQPHRNVDFLLASVGRTARNATQTHTVNTTMAFQPKTQQSVDFLPASGEKTVRFSASDAAMDMIQSHTVNIPKSSIPDSDLPHHNVLPGHENVEFPKKRDNEICGLRRSRSLSACGLFTNLPSKTHGTLANPKPEGTDTPFSQETADQMNPANKAPGLVSAAMEKSVMTDSEDLNASMDMTEAQTGNIYGQMHTDEPPPCDSLAQNPNLKKVEVTSAQRSEETSSKPDSVEISPSLYSTEREARQEPSSPSAVDQDADRIYSRKSRRMTLADLQTKIRRLSHMVSTAPDATAMDSCTAPLPKMDHNLNSQDKITSAPEVEPEPEIREDTQAAAPSATTPFNMKTNQLMSRLSMGGFKPKLPQKRKPDDSKKLNCADHTKTIALDFTSQLNNFDADERGICDEELDSYEDVSETLDRINLQKISDKEGPSTELNMVVANDVFKEDFISPVQKRPLPDNENNMEDMKRMNKTTDIVESALQFDVRAYDSNITVAHSASQTMDSSSSIHTTSSRCEATFESSFKPSLLESQLEDYASDVQKKLEEGTITVLEFFKLFNIDFVIHNPRQSVLPRVLSDTDVTPMDLLKNKHIGYPKQMVYEADVQALTEKVEGLKVRMQDLDKPLKSVNKPLWEEMRCSSEKELKSFGSKLKERNNFFRKMGKVKSHEMKEVLYANLVQVNLEEQQKLRGTIKQADEMINSLDDCIHELETELAAVEEKGFEDKPSLKSLQEEMDKVTESKAECDRQTTELEMQMKQNSSELKRLKAETNDLEIHLDILKSLNEWTLKERNDNCTVVTFLNETIYLQLDYENSNGNGCDGVSEQKIANIAFKFELDAEKSWCHARLVHKLLSHYVEGEPAWVEKYPTSRYVPKLLQDVSLVVSRCRLMGEEIRLLKMWGGLRLDVLDISCVDTQLHIVFSSLEKLSKFEVIFGVRLTDRLCVFQLEGFKNMFGNTTSHQIEEIVVLFTPGKKLLTKIVRKIHDTLLS